MKLTVLGSGDASNSAGRGHSCYWIEGATPHGLMVDFGGTALMQLWRFGKDPGELGTLVFTHLHGDHIGGFPYFFVDALYSASRPQRSAPLTIVGPVGVRERLMDLLRVTYRKLADKEIPFPLTWHELAPGGELRLDGCAVRGFPADHMSPPEQPLCLRITADSGTSVAFSGDTRLGAGLRAAADGVDLLIAECTGLRAPLGKHCTWEEWETELPTFNARHILLTHLGADVRAQVGALIGAAPTGVHVVFADDGLELDVSP